MTLSLLLLAALAPQDLCFQPVTTVPLPGGTDSLAVTAGDLNGDGAADLVAGAKPGNVRVLLGCGGGWLVGPPIPAGEAVNDLSLGDVDGDGKLDLAVGDLGGGAAHVLIGDGTGGFGLDIPLPSAATTPSPYSIALADFDGDGMLDVAALNYFNAAHGLETWLGTSGGSFAASSTNSTGTNPNGLAIADLNLDGDLDCIVSTRGGETVETFLGCGSGSLTKHVAVLVPNAPIGIAAADLDGDGVPDVVVTQPDTDKVLLLLGDGLGDFPLPQVPFNVGDFPGAVALDDVDADGELDIIVSGDAADVSVLRGLGGGAFEPQQTFPVGPNSADLVTHDLDADGRADVAVSYIHSPDVGMLLSGCPPTITATTPTSAQSPGIVSVTGENLQQVTSATIQGQPATIVAQGATFLDLQPLPSDPDFDADLALASPVGGANAPLELWPSLTPSLSPGFLHVELDQGTAGTWVLAFAGTQLSTPIPIGWPPSAYGLLLGPPLAIADSSVTVTPDPIQLTYAIPPLPSLSGATFYLQGWMAECYFPFFCPASFTNAEGVTLP